MFWSVFSIHMLQKNKFSFAENYKQWIFQDDQDKPEFKVKNVQKNILMMTFIISKSILKMLQNSKFTC